MAATSNGYHQDSDVDSDGSVDDAYYHPISADSDDGGDLENEYPSSSVLQTNAPDPNNGYLDGSDLLHHYAQSGVAGLDLNGGGDGESDEEEEMDREREASISRAFREDESRRSAPLTEENAARVLEAMRGVVFPGVVPNWAGEIAEERWVDQLRQLRGEPAP
ncbi:uncharacterized protein LOC120265710 [Dioscorea cayenensis subsp. rotundata]|uniref:Uncharacterized protein LOC120265710 n=1 Tax=Dioscorea cayennensis subsp. rotundata TaxID=55577 RepID=A0AB40BR09_DIOCR|nr:uncharacterized protein LOC120265710 [Dioscorea cayenensis subsp. rotundata]